MPFINLKGVGFVFVMVTLNATLRLLQIPSVLLYPFALTSYRSFNRVIEAGWAYTIIISSQWFNNAKLVVSGDDIPPQTNVILMTNHQTFADWWYLWSFAYNRGHEAAIKVILKNQLKFTPLFGGGMRGFNFIFLKRKWEKDSKHMEQVLTSYKEHTVNQPFWLVIFPEGTIIRKESREKSNQFAKQEGFAPFKHQLAPRTTGLKFCVDKLRGTAEYIVDVTIGYKGVQAGQNASEVYKLRSIFLLGIAPPEVHIHVENIPLDTIPSGEAEFKEWMIKQFHKKDQLLDKFYVTGSFSDKSRVETVRVRSYLPLIAISTLTVVFAYGFKVALYGF